MRLRLVAVGNRMPAWVDAGFAEYARRFPPHLPLSLTEIAPGARTKGADVTRVLGDECQRCLKAVGDAHLIALERRGRPIDTDGMAVALEEWLQQGRDVAFLIGGPEGLAPDCLQRAERQWSLSALTLPHAMVRVLLAEQLYRAFSILQNLPYHRGA